MSTILKALRRLEQEKTRPDRPLREQVTGSNGAYRGENGPPRRWPILLGGIGAGVFAGLAVLLLVFSRGNPADEAAPTVAVPAPPPAAGQVSPPDAAAGTPRPAGVPVQPPAERVRSDPATDPDLPEDVAVIDRGSPGPRTIAEAGPDPAVEPAPPKPGSVRPRLRGDPEGLPGRHLLPEGEPAAPPVDAPDAVAPIRAPAPAPPPAPLAARTPAVAPAPAIAPAPVVAPAREIPSAPPAPAATPKPAPGSPAASPRPATASFPALRVERTTWHPLAERRVAVIEVPGAGEQSVHEGDVVSGARVKRIEPSGVVFDHAGREVRRSIGEGRLRTPSERLGNGG